MGLTDVSFARRVVRCEGPYCDKVTRRGYYITGPAPEYRIRFVCSEECATTLT